MEPAAPRPPHIAHRTLPPHTPHIPHLTLPHTRHTRHPQRDTPHPHATPRASQVLEMEPAHLDTHAVVSGSTQVFPDGDPLSEEDVQEEELVGYEDVGGLEKQIGMVRP